ncbi:MAG: WXG100 family type VII secretion target [Deltaproteobacteria bacterium]|jgi:uncharacterized protein YukE|nr:WXG100 family type VII secretion target [Deltaproteobacteria bacterium]
MSQSTVNLQKMKTAAAELEKNYRAMANNKQKLDEIMAALPKVWSGEGAQTFLKAYQSNSRDFQLLAESIRNCATTLTGIVSSYGKADLAASEAIKSKLAKG